MISQTQDQFHTSATETIEQGNLSLPAHVKNYKVNIKDTYE